MTDLTAQKPHAARGRGQSPLQLQTITMGPMVLEVAEIGGDQWFYAPSLAKKLDYRDATELLRGVPVGERSIHLVQTSSGGTQEATFIDLGGLARVVTRSRSDAAEPFCNWMIQEYFPTAVRLYRMNQKADQLGVTFNFTDSQWEWLRLHFYMMDLLPLAMAGYNSLEITQLLGYHTKSGITARKRIHKLRELGFLPMVIEPRVKQLERRIKAQRAANQAALQGP